MVKEKYIRPGLRKDIVQWARDCIPCQRAKIHRHTRIQPTNIDVPDERGKHVHIDLITLPACEGFRYCLTIIDRYARFPHAVPLQDMRVESVAFAFWSGWISFVGPPETITTYQGTQFESALFASLAQFIGSNRIHTTPYHPQGNGMVERSHRTLKAALMCNTETPWVMSLYTVLMSMRAAIKEDLGMSPYQLLFGAPMRLPGDFLSPSDEPTQETATFVGKLIDHFKRLKPIPTSHHRKAKNNFVHRDLGTCTHVFRRVNAVKPPLTPPYTGPFKVVRRLDDRRYVMDVNGEKKTLSTQCLKPAYMSSYGLEEGLRAQQRRVTFNLPVTAQPAMQQPAPPRASVQQHTQQQATSQRPAGQQPPLLQQPNTQQINS